MFGADGRGGTVLTIFGNRQAYWAGDPQAPGTTCAPNGAPGLSTDAILTVTNSGTCQVTFPPLSR